MGTSAIQTIARVGASLVLAATVAGCGSRSSPTSDADLVGSTATVTSSAPAASRPLSDFYDAPHDPGQYPPTPPYHSFGTPSGQIQCRVVDGTLACQTGGHPHTVADDALCGFYPGVEQGNTSRFGYFQGGPQPCATIIQGDGFNSPHTLAYGESVTADLPSGRTVTCSSAVEGLTCTEAGGIGPRGFFLSVDEFTLL